MTTLNNTFPQFQRLYENDAFLVIHKPAGLVCHPTKKGPGSSLIDQIRRYLNPDFDFASPNWSETKAVAALPESFVFPRMINRLDRETSGVQLIAKTAEAASEFGKLWEAHGATKVYWALLHGWVETDRGVIDWPLGKDEASEVAVKDKVRPDGFRSISEYKVLARFLDPTDSHTRITWMEIRPRTGKKHQIRIHFSSLGYPVLGDKLYGPDENLYLKLAQGQLEDSDWKRLKTRNQALHAVQLGITYQETPMEFSSLPETEFMEKLGGQSKNFDIILGKANF
jgi:23S rRNA pseudouridine1911/1915/1917 synthase